MGKEKKYPETLELAIEEIKTLEANLEAETKAHTETKAAAQKDAEDGAKLIAELSKKLAAEEKSSTTKGKHTIEVEVEVEGESGKKEKATKTFSFAKSFKVIHDGRTVTAEDVLADKTLATELAACNVFEEVKA